ncbi:MAG: asparagine synthase (glutamine-hydrolyzing) [Acidobacteria bacterium]|nr:asparagine synthase (glutamine-hydrolyzing) [Acidobacteriota bacterium]
MKFDPRERVEEDRLRRMRDVLRHRGPDGEGLMIRGPVGLAHRRLAIIDVEGGHQPMSNEDGSIWITFNGEVYNHAELRPRLQARGHVYRTRSDTETILHLYEDEGDRALDRLHGMFAFALWDANRRRLLLARDRLGIKPLYYTLTGTELLFGSEIKALLAAGSMRASFNEEVLPEFLATRFVSGEQTFFRGVRKLLPGHVLIWSGDRHMSQQRYWRLPAPAGSDRSPGSIRREARILRSDLEGAVERHLMSDVPLGVFLSGGIDSSALAALVARATCDRIRTFAVGFTDKDASELPYARMAADHVGAHHHEVTVPPAQFFKALPHLVWQEDEPMAFPSSVPLYFVAALAREHVKVVLTGEGADELFLGYNRYRVTWWNARLARVYHGLVPSMIRSHIQRVLGKLPARAGRLAGRTFLALEPNVRTLFFENFSVVPERMQRRLLQRRDLLEARDPYEVVVRCFETADGDLLDRMSRTDLQTYLLELLMKQDQMSMAASIESRVPFLDDHIVERVAAWPSALKLRGWRTKAVFRAAVDDLVPPPILMRRKMGFPVPLARWFRDGFSPLLGEYVLGPRPAARGYFDPPYLRRLVDEHQSGAVSHADRLWLLINLEIWFRIFCDGEDPAQMPCESSG